MHIRYADLSSPHPLSDGEVLVYPTEIKIAVHLITLINGH